MTNPAQFIKQLKKCLGSSLGGQGTCTWPLIRERGLIYKMFPPTPKVARFLALFPLPLNVKVKGV